MIRNDTRAVIIDDDGNHIANAWSGMDATALVEAHNAALDAALPSAPKKEGM